MIESRETRVLKIMSDSCSGVRKDDILCNMVHRK